MLVVGGIGVEGVRGSTTFNFGDRNPIYSEVQTVACLAPIKSIQILILTSIDSNILKFSIISNSFY